LIVLNEGGVKEGQYVLEEHSDVRRFLPHPQGHRLCILTESSLWWVELASAPE
jgi:hypothetical protein